MESNILLFRTDRGPKLEALLSIADGIGETTLKWKGKVLTIRIGEIEYSSWLSTYSAEGRAHHEKLTLRKAIAAAKDAGYKVMYGEDYGR